MLINESIVETFLHYGNRAEQDSVERRYAVSDGKHELYKATNQGLVQRIHGRCYMDVSLITIIVKPF